MNKTISPVKVASDHVDAIKAQIKRCDNVAEEAQQVSTALEMLRQERADLTAHAFLKQETCDTTGIDAKIAEAEIKNADLHSQANAATGAREMLAAQLAEAEKLLETAQQDRRLQCFQLLVEERNRASEEYTAALDALRLSLIHMDAAWGLSTKYEVEGHGRLSGSEYLRRNLYDGLNWYQHWVDDRRPAIQAEIAERLGLDSV
ncbi:hypothetical protein [Paralcaligenes ginsengisoli]